MHWISQKVETFRNVFLNHFTYHLHQMQICTYDNPLQQQLGRGWASGGSKRSFAKFWAVRKSLENQQWHHGSAWREKGKWRLRNFEQSKVAGKSSILKYIVKNAKFGLKNPLQKNTGQNRNSEHIDRLSEICTCLSGFSEKLAIPVSKLQLPASPTLSSPRRRCAAVTQYIWLRIKDCCQCNNTD